MKKEHQLGLIALIVFFHVFCAEAAFPKFSWHAGCIVYWDNQAVEGELSYNWLTEMVMLRQTDGKIITLTSRQLSQFSWFDYSTHKLRLFKVIDDERSELQPNLSFYEVCFNGSLTVVRRLHKPHGLFKRVFSHPIHFEDQPTMAQNTDCFEYFVYTTDHLLTLDRFALDIYENLMAAHHQQLKTYVREHNINDHSLSGRLVLIARYNAMVESDGKAASVNEASPSSGSYSAPVVGSSSDF